MNFHLNKDINKNFNYRKSIDHWTYTNNMLFFPSFLCFHTKQSLEITIEIHFSFIASSFNKSQKKEDKKKTWYVNKKDKKNRWRIISESLIRNSKIIAENVQYAHSFFIYWNARCLPNCQEIDIWIVSILSPRSIQYSNIPILNWNASNNATEVKFHF